MRLIAKLEQMLTPTVEECGVQLYDIEYVKEGGSRILRLFIDKEDGVDLNDCERVSRAVSDVLDGSDPIPDSYRLQVGSPGIERRLVKPEHFKRYEGHKVLIKLFSPHAPQDPDHAESITTGRKKFTGILTAYDDGNITLTDEENQIWYFDKKQVSACKLVVEY
jgi:ribosome maturation factor RimP